MSQIFDKNNVLVDNIYNVPNNDKVQLINIAGNAGGNNRAVGITPRDYPRIVKIATNRDVEIRSYANAAGAVGGGAKGVLVPADTVQTWGIRSNETLFVYRVEGNATRVTVAEVSQQYDPII